MITLDHVRYTAARLAWLHYYGKPTPGEVVHGAGGQLDNSIKNLSVKPHGTHRRTTKVSIESGAKGVQPNNSKKNPWRARVATGGRQQVNVGSFPCITRAAKAYDAFVKENLGPEHITNEQLGFFKYSKACACCH